MIMGLDDPPPPPTHRRSPEAWVGGCGGGILPHDITGGWVLVGQNVLVCTHSTPYDILN